MQRATPEASTRTTPARDPESVAGTVSPGGHADSSPSTVPSLSSWPDPVEGRFACRPDVPARPASSAADGSDCHKTSREQTAAQLTVLVETRYHGVPARTV